MNKLSSTFPARTIVASIKELGAGFLRLRSKSSDSYLPGTCAQTTRPGRVCRENPIVLSGIGAADFGDWSLRFGDALWVAAKANERRTGSGTR
jgi:hypothetical protein